MKECRNRLKMLIKILELFVWRDVSREAKCRRSFSLILVLLTMVLSFPVNGESDEEEGAAVEQYIPTGRSYITNFHDPYSIRYIRTDIFIKVNDDITAQAVLGNLPLIRHTLIHFLNAQDEEAVVTPDGKFQMRERARKELQEVLQEEVSGVNILELLFTNYFVE